MGPAEVVCVTWGADGGFGGPSIAPSAEAIVAAKAEAVLIPVSNLDELAAARALIASVDAALGLGAVSFFAAISEAVSDALPDDFPPPFEGFARIEDPQFHSHIRAWLHGLTKAAVRTTQAEARYAALFAHINDAAILADADTGIILDVNRRALELWGKRREEMVGHSQASLHPVHELGREIFQKHRKALEEQGFAPTSEFPILHKDGRVIDVEISASRFTIGSQARLLGLFRDCTERKATAAALRVHEAQRERTQRLEGLATLAAGVGHEVNNPLAYLMGNLEFLAGEFARQKLPDDLTEALKDAVDGAERLRTVVRGLQALDPTTRRPAPLTAAAAARERAPAPPPAERPKAATAAATTLVARVAEAVDGAVEGLRFRHRGLCTISVAPIPPTLAVHLTPARLSQVLVNLLTNALDAFSAARRAPAIAEGEPPHISITVTTDDARVSARPDAGSDSAFVTIAIADNGIGMSAEALERAFDPSFSTKSLTSEPPSSRVGLGLGLSKKFVATAGGTLTLTSTRRTDGTSPSGTTATIRLRRAEGSGGGS